MGRARRRSGNPLWRTGGHQPPLHSRPPSAVGDRPRDPSRSAEPGASRTIRCDVPTAPVTSAHPSSEGSAFRPQLAADPETRAGRPDTAQIGQSAAARRCTPAASPQPSAEGSTLRRQLAAGPGAQAGRPDPVQVERSAAGHRQTPAASPHPPPKRAARQTAVGGPGRRVGPAVAPVTRRRHRPAVGAVRMPAGPEPIRFAPVAPKGPDQDRSRPPRRTGTRSVQPRPCQLP